MDRFEFHVALAEIFEAASAINAFIEASAPWSLAKQGKKEEVAGCLYRAADAVRVLGLLMAPFTPGMSDRIFEQLGIPEIPRRLEAAQAQGYIKTGTRVRKGPVLFQTIDAEQP
jgi:methionyl-tRNA synthetase